MKLTRLQTVLYIILLAATAYIAWWMLFGADFTMEAPAPADEGEMHFIALSPEHELAANLARAGGVVLFLLAIGGLVIHFTQKNRTAFIVFNVITGLLAIYVSIYGFPTEFTSKVAVGELNLLKVYSTPGATERIVMIATGIAALLGLAAAGLKIAETVKAKQQQP